MWLLSRMEVEEGQSTELDVDFVHWFEELFTLIAPKVLSKVFI